MFFQFRKHNQYSIIPEIDTYDTQNSEGALRIGSLSIVGVKIMDFLEVVIHTFLKKLKIAFKCNIDGKDIKRHYLLNGFIVLCSTTLRNSKC